MRIFLKADLGFLCENKDLCLPILDIFVDFFLFGGAVFVCFLLGEFCF